MTKTEVAWLAGLLEGEGCFNLKRYSKYKPHYRDSLRVQVSMTDRDVVERVAHLIHYTGTIQEQTRGEPRQTAYIVAVSGQEAADIMLAVRPYMGIRRGAKIDELLALPNLNHHPRAKEAA